MEEKEKMALTLLQNRKPAFSPRPIRSHNYSGIGSINGRSEQPCGKRSTASGKRSPGVNTALMPDNVALGLMALGLQRGDRVAIISENNPEWLYSDMGILAVGGVTVGIYPTDSANQVEYVLNHSGAKFYIAEDEEQLDKVLEVRGNIPGFGKDHHHRYGRATAFFQSHGHQF